VKEKENRRKFWSDAILEGNLKLDTYVGDGNAKKFRAGDERLSLESIISGGVASVGSINPVEDFKSMFKRRDMDLVDKAITEMKDVILKLVHESVKQSYYNKAIECLQTFREGCIKEEEAEQFNEFLLQLKKNFKDKKRHDFWQIIVQKKNHNYFFQRSR